MSGLVRSVGRTAALVPAGPSAAALAAAAARLPGVVDAVVGADTVLVVADSSVSLDRVLAAVAAAQPEGAPPADADLPPADADLPPADADLVEIPTVYDGPDLAEVAERLGVGEGEVVSLHASASYRVAFVGFAPGFGYLDGLPSQLHLPRRPQPRERVPAGAVAIADRYSAVYPRATPGGWHLLGHTDEVLFDPGREPPALLRPGAPVSFVPVGRRRRRSGPGAPVTAIADEGRPALVVVDAGGTTTVQDRGRPGRAAEGVPPSGFADRAAAQLANRLVGNDPGAALLETTMAGPVLRLRAAMARTVVVTGPPGPVTVDGIEAAPDAPFRLAPGATLVVGPPRVGLRRYLAVAGGLDPPAVLGSRSTDQLTGLGPAPVAAGAAVPLGPDHGRTSGVDVAPVRRRPVRVVLRATPGPHAGLVTGEGLHRLGATDWVVAPSSNRVGVRLDGPGLPRIGAGEVAPVGLLTGAVQLTPGGQLVVFGPDHPVTGGYPLVAVIDPADLDLCAQLRPGEPVRLQVARPPGGAG